MKSIRWKDKAGAWIGVGTSPAMLIVGAQMAERHGGPVPVLSLLIGLGIIFAFAWLQGRFGLQPPLGEGGTLTQVIPHYFGKFTYRTLGLVMAAAMLGWFGFNVGLGGTALATLVGLPSWIGILVIGVPVVILSLGELQRWNAVASLTAVSALLLVGLVVFGFAARRVPVTFQLDSPALLLSDVIACIGATSVFAMRAPDFTFGLRSRRDLTYCVLLLVGAFLCVALAGIGLQMGTGSTDLVGILASGGGLAFGNLFVASSVIAPSFTTVFSGAMAIQTATGLKRRQAIAIMAVVGLALAISRFDRQLVPWLSLLAAVLPPIALCMIVEAARRRQQEYIPRLMPMWTWASGSAPALILALIKEPLAPVIGLVVTLLALGVWSRLPTSTPAYLMEHEKAKE